MITFITEAKSDINRTNGLQDSREITKRDDNEMNESVASRISQASRMPTRGATAIPHVGHFWNSSGLERRMCLERLSFSLEVSLFHNDQSLGSGNIRNVGGRGVFIETSSQLVEGTPLQLCFTLGGNSRLPSHRVMGRVAHVTHEGIGVHLDVLRRDTLTGLQALKKQAGREHKSKSSS
jgi:hypothetical protein